MAELGPCAIAAAESPPPPENPPPPPVANDILNQFLSFLTRTPFKKKQCWVLFGNWGEVELFQVQNDVVKNNNRSKTNADPMFSFASHKRRFS
mmetsp:Transcript_1336/g.2158  ORF Transcript_1336/g.2158 Transcript_1336/m.2158 type:complete len:93 (+) Transcript_1336:1760-2038(+)